MHVERDETTVSKFLAEKGRASASANREGNTRAQSGGTRLGKRQHLHADIHGDNLATVRIVMEVFSCSNRNFQYSA